MVSLDDIRVDDHLNYVERPLAVLDRKMKALRNMVVSFFVQGLVAASEGFQKYLRTRGGDARALP